MSSSNVAAQRPDPHLHDLARRAVSLWDLEVESLEPIKVRENAVYGVVSRDGRRAVLRIHRLGYHSNDALRSEFEWMEALRRAGISVPRPLQSRAGRNFEELEAAHLPGARQVDVLEWLDGVHLGSIERGISAEAGSVEGAYRAIGEVAARIHNQAADWPRPAGFIRHAWDLDGLIGNRPFWGPFWQLDSLSASQRALMERVRARLKRDLEEFGTGRDRFGLIHADLVPENVLVNGNRLSVIDFDDAGFGWHLFEIATTLYFIRREHYYARALDAVIAGYRAHRALPDSDLERLPALLAARGTTYLGWIHSRRTEPAARALAPQVIELAMSVAEEYLSDPG